MKTFRFKILFIGVACLLYAVPTLLSAVQSSSACDKVAVPAPIRELLRDKFAHWKPKEIADMDPDDQHLWLTGDDGKACPGIAIGHFENADSLSYAFLLVPRSNPSGGHKILVFSKAPGKNVYGWTLLDHSDRQTYSGLVISRAEPGKYQDWEGKRSIQIRTDGLYVEWMEKGGILYYWSAGGYHKLHVSD
jgi:hypothetical protein